jgi:hypothetical protein
VVKINRETKKLINAMLADSFKPFQRRRMLDVYTHYGALEELKTNKPRVLYISYGETDEWAHAGFIVRIWMQLIKSMHGSKRFGILFKMTLSKRQTALVFTTDHGR